MPDTSDINRLVKIDLNSMLYFVAYMRCGKLSIISAKFSCSQATASIMLRRFCLNFEREVFARKTRTLTPTVFAYELYTRCEIIMRELNEVFFHPDDFSGESISPLELPVTSCECGAMPADT